MAAMRIGCDNLVWCPLTKDDGTLLTYGTPVELPGLMKIGLSLNSSSATAFYDNGPGETASTMGAIEVTVDKNALSSTEIAMLLGHKTTTNGIIVSSSDDVSPEGALGYRTLKSNGKHVLVWLLKGSFGEPDEETETKGDSINFQNSSLVGNFAKVNKKFTIGTESKQPWRTMIDEEDASATPEISAAFFDQVVLPDETFI